MHTSKEHEGQIYIPEVNRARMIGCIFIVLGFLAGMFTFRIKVRWCRECGATHPGSSTPNRIRVSA